MKKALVVIDMQNDFIDGALGTPEAVLIVPRVLARVKAAAAGAAAHGTKLIFTQDTHAPDYLLTAEGKKLPVEHCVKPSKGWEISPVLLPYTKKA
ncbi:MAG: cysteine hydrolase family protein, partial [Oscillospiraceae bacterium]|nr:cysteine hydrolase family protein [Oscillospiraceae bacterium]